MRGLDTPRSASGQPWHIRSEEELLRPYLDHQRLDFDGASHDVSYLDDSVVMITGGGGSIGSRLASLLLSSSTCRRVVLVDNSEDGLYSFWSTTMRSDRDVELDVELVDIRDRASLQRVLDHHRPDVVFHYANYKSAALGELVPTEFAQVNISGTLNLLDAARDSVGTFVYISSDKAECPTTTYGRTKRLSELLLAAWSRKVSMNCASIRYCNVLDAAGSYAIPTFRRQLLEATDITIRRHADGRIPDRYFVDMRTALLAAVVAGSHAAQGQVFTFDREQLSAISMVDLVATIARASGRRASHRWLEHAITYTDLMPGEKISELLGTGERLPGSPLACIAPPAGLDGPELLTAARALVAHVNGLSQSATADEVRGLLQTYDRADGHALVH